MRKKLMMSFCAFLLVLATGLAQTTSVTGKVTDENGNPLSGASVLERGTKNGVSADASGAFTIKVKSGSTLVVSAIGYENQQVSSNSTNLLIKLATDTRALSEVVVTGTGVATSKKRLSISVESISADKLPAAPSASIDQALAGKIAGAQISSSSGNPGSAASIQLRGINTIGGGTQPMILVDGVEMGASALNTLDLNTVERVEVVQGAASSTIYGAQGANGVIQIFTKKGKAGKSRIDLSSRVSYDNYINVGNVRQPLNHSFTTNANGDILNNSGGLLSVDANGVWDNGTWENGATAQNNKPYKGNTKYYDHIAQLYREARTTNSSISFSGAKEKSDYSINLSQLSQESIIDGGLKRTNLTLNYGFEVLKNLKVRAITQLAYTDNTTGNQGISSALYTYPFADFASKDADGNTPYYFGAFAGANSRNPYYARQYRAYGDKQVDVIPSLNVNYKFPKFVELDYKYGINQNRQDYTRTDANQTLNKNAVATSKYIGNDISGTIYNYTQRTTTQNSLFTATAKFDFEKDFGFNNLPITATTTAIYDWREKKRNYTALNFVGLPLYTANANQAATKSVLEVYEDLFRTFGLYVNQKFEWSDLAGVSAGVRSDYSSAFGSGQTAQQFPRGDAYFRLSSLGFWNNGKISEIVPEFKLRGAFGEAGIQPGVFDRIPTLSSGITTNGSYFYNPARLANQNLTVERSQELEIGTDFSLKLGKKAWFRSLNVSATYWNRKGTNVIWVIPVPISSGASEIKSNVLDLSSNGFQASLDLNVYKGKNLDWNLTAAFGTTKTFTDNIYGTPDIPLVWGSAATYTLRPGEQFGTIYGYKGITSIDQKDADGAYYLDQADKANYEIVNGIVVEKASKRAQFTSDKWVLGNTTPKFNLSFTNTINYKNYLSFSFQFDWYYGSKQYNQTKEWMYSEGLHGDFDKPVTINGQTGAWVAYYRSFYDASESNGTKDYFLENSSFLRLRNISVSLDFAKLFKVPFTDKLQLFMSGRNLFTISKYTGMDPEANENTTGGGSTSSTQTSVQRGLDYFSFPNTKSIQVGLNIGIN
jgi:TonB-linked SusC/RagA family outer membrane protein